MRYLIKKKYSSLANTAASKLSISSHLLAKITGTIFLSVETYEDRNEKKMNIGMNLKSNKRNEEVLIIFIYSYNICYINVVFI